jgi:hypothetical protein
MIQPASYAIPHDRELIGYAVIIKGGYGFDRLPAAACHVSRA